MMVIGNFRQLSDTVIMTTNEASAANEIKTLIRLINLLINTYANPNSKHMWAVNNSYLF